MKDVYEVLRQKEIELVRLRQEVDALKLIIPLVVEEDDIPQPDKAEDREVLLTANREGTRKAQIRYSQGKC